MFKFKKNDNKNKQPKEAPNFMANVGDFEYANLDASMHERPIQGKPTTYLKDALKRFMKNRSSVAAFVILLILIVMAIIVPFANKNDIARPNPRTRYLPPKWNEVNSSHFMDGTGFVKEAVLDPNPVVKDGEKIWVPGKNSGYVADAIISDIDVQEKVTTSYSDALGDYGTGGAFVVSTSPNGNGGFKSQERTFNINDDFSFEITFDADKFDYDEDYSYYAAMLINTGKSYETVGLTEPLTVGTNSIKFKGDFKNKITESEYYKSLDTKTDEFNGCFALVINATKTAQNIPVTSIDFSKATLANEENKLFLEWTDATRAYTHYHKNEKIEVTQKIEGTEETTKIEVPCAYEKINDKTGFNLLGGRLYYGDFQYDYYKAAYGEVEGHSFSESDIRTFIKNGWVEFDIDNYCHTEGTGEIDPNAFKLTAEGEVYCPMRSAKNYSCIYNAGLGESFFTVEGTLSQYRLDYQEGILHKCESPKFAFGTNKAGQDFFKLVFSGLLTSLGLGFLSSFINIAIGLIWGSVSGYFGGWVDLLMERFTEILGGMPWIVMMTLIVLLLGSSFWTFLLALCLTGWMGVAHMARSQFYRFKGREYVLASRTLGASDGRLIFKHIMPNGIGTIITSSVLMIPSVIFVEANISYLLPNALALKGSQSFGITLASAQAELAQYPYLIVSASIIMALIMISFNLFGNGLRDAFNPSLKGADE